MPAFRDTDLLSKYMDSLNGINGSILRHLISTSGSSRFAMTAYRSEPTRSAYSLTRFLFGKTGDKEVRSLEIS